MFDISYRGKKNLEFHLHSSLPQNPSQTPHSPPHNPQHFNPEFRPTRAQDSECSGVRKGRASGKGHWMVLEYNYSVLKKDDKRCPMPQCEKPLSNARDLNYHLAYGHQELEFFKRKMKSQTRNDTESEKQH